jgi:hypothetical protein
LAAEAEVVEVMVKMVVKASVKIACSREEREER